MKVQDLMERVCQVITKTSFYREKLKIQCLHWNSLCVDIDDMLLHETVLGEEKPKVFIEGKVTHQEKGRGLYWNAPLKYEIFRVYQLRLREVEVNSLFDHIEILLLVHRENKQYHFLRKKTGRKNALEILTKDTLDENFVEILQNILRELDFAPYSLFEHL